MPTELHFSINLNHAPHIVSAAATTHGIEGKQVVEKYHMMHLWCIHVYRYHARLLISGEEFALYPGCATLIAPGAELEYHFDGLSPHTFVHFTMPPGAPGEDIWQVPALIDLGADLARIENALKHIGAGSGSDVRKQVLLWEVLWQLAERAAGSPERGHPSLEKARMLIDLRLNQSINVASLARECGISHNHLTRLFQKELGQSVMAYIRARRVERACHLLEQSSLPPKAIAMQIGVPEARQFWALIKKETGRTPREWQARK